MNGLTPRALAAPLRVLFSGFLVTIGLGYLAAAYLLSFGTIDPHKKMGMGPVGAVAAKYYGERDRSRLEAALRGTNVGARRGTGARGDHRLGARRRVARRLRESEAGFRPELRRLPQRQVRPAGTAPDELRGVKKLAPDGRDFRLERDAAAPARGHPGASPPHDLGRHRRVVGHQVRAGVRLGRGGERRRDGPRACSADFHSAAGDVARPPRRTGELIPIKRRPATCGPMAPWKSRARSTSVSPLRSRRGVLAARRLDEHEPGADHPVQRVPASPQIEGKLSELETLSLGHVYSLGIATSLNLNATPSKGL